MRRRLRRRLLNAPSGERVGAGARPQSIAQNLAMFKGFMPKGCRSEDASDDTIDSAANVDCWQSIRPASRMQPSMPGATLLSRGAIEGEFAGESLKGP